MQEVPEVTTTTLEDALILTAAITTHHVNRVYCRGLGDQSQPDWAHAPDRQRNSALAGVRAIFDDPSTTPEQSHEGWMRQKSDDGWVYGEVKDAAAKTHPYMVSYAELNSAQRAKNILFGAVVRGILSL